LSEPELSGEAGSGVAACAIEFLDYMSVEKGASVNTAAAYRRVLREYAGFLAKRGVSEPADIGRDDSREFVAYLKGQGSRGALGRAGSQRAARLSPLHDR
jgi:site-specific recombinase XerD